MQHELLLLDRRAQVAFNFHPLQRCTLQFGGKELEVAPPLGLGVIHRDIGLFQQVIAFGRIGRIEAHANAGPGTQLVTIDGIGLRHGNEDFFGDMRGIGR